MCREEAMVSCSVLHSPTLLEWRQSNIFGHQPSDNNDTTTRSLSKTTTAMLLDIISRDARLTHNASQSTYKIFASTATNSTTAPKFGVPHVPLWMTHVGDTAGVPRYHKLDFPTFNGKDDPLRARPPSSFLLHITGMVQNSRRVEC